MKKLVYLFLFIGIFGCKEAEPRKPIKVNSGSFYKQTIERNKQLLADEEKAIQHIIKKDTANTYINSGSGSWFYYNIKNNEDTYTPKTDDLVTMSYALMTFSNDTIYSNNDIGIVNYKVDKQQLFKGLRNAVKLLKEKETATFLFPSSLAYGYHGDENKIGVNQPIKASISILKIDKQSINSEN